jgi:hypothetical protein
MQDVLVSRVGFSLFGQEDKRDERAGVAVMVMVMVMEEMEREWLFPDHSSQ